MRLLRFPALAVFGLLLLALTSLPSLADGTHMATYPADVALVYSTYPDADFNAPVGTHISVAVGGGFVQGTYVVGQSLPAFYDPGDGHGMRTILSLSPLAGYTPLNGVAASGGVWAYGDTVPSNAPAIAIPNPAPITTVTGPLSFLLVGDSITQYQEQQFQDYLAAKFPKAVVTSYNDGQPGSTLEDWLPGGYDYFSIVQDCAVLQAKLVHIMLTTNDSKDGVATPAATVQANIQTLVDHIYADCPTVVAIQLECPPYVVPGSLGTYSTASNIRLRAYADAFSNITRVHLGTDLYDFFASYPSLLADGVHPGANSIGLNPSGQQALVAYWAQAAMPTLASLPLHQPAPPGTPTATAQSITTTQATPVAVTLTGTDPNNLALTYAVGTRPANGTLSGTAPNLTYTPDSDYFGSDSFTFTVSNGTYTSDPATVGLTVSPLVLSSLTFPSPVSGGTVLTATVTLSSITPTDAVIGLSSNDPSVVRINRGVIVPAGSSSATFAINTFRSHVAKTVTITATLGQAVKTIPLTITGR